MKLTPTTKIFAGVIFDVPDNRNKGRVHIRAETLDRTICGVHTPAHAPFTPIEGAHREDITCPSCLITLDKTERKKYTVPRPLGNPRHRKDAVAPEKRYAGFHMKLSAIGFVIFDFDDPSIGHNEYYKNGTFKRGNLKTTLERTQVVAMAKQFLTDNNIPIYKGLLT